MKEKNKYFYPPLPPQLKDKWYITDTLTSSGNSQVYIINRNTNDNITDNNIIYNKRILKIVHEMQFQKKVYNIISSITSNYIQKPIKIILYKHNYYIINKYQLNLRTIISQKGITQNDILHLASDISSSLEILHSKKILHLDCTPSNIYINDNGTYCLGDFSSAIFLKNIHSPSTFTPGYVPPEISDNEPLSVLSDEYIFSSLLYTLFNNGYTANSNNPDGNIKNNIPENLYSIIMKGCSKNPSDRFPSITEMNNKLNSATILENLSLYNYHLYITDLSHPLYYLKTSLTIIKSSHVYKKQQKTHLLYYSLLILTGCIFIFSLFNYFNKNTSSPKYNQNFEENKETNEIENEEIEADLSNKNIFSLPNPQSASFLCDKLTILYADINKIDNLDNIIYYTSLKELYLSDNHISSLIPLENTDNLEILVLSYNKITDLSPLGPLTSLTNLDLSGNKNMYNFNELVSLYNLKTLNVTNTNITPGEIKFLTSNLPNCEIFY